MASLELLRGLLLLLMVPLWLVMSLMTSDTTDSSSLTLPSRESMLWPPTIMGSSLNRTICSFLGAISEKGRGLLVAGRGDRIGALSDCRRDGRSVSNGAIGDGLVGWPKADRRRWAALAEGEGEGEGLLEGDLLENSWPCIAAPE